ncbi:Hypothetical_protein [Hexamita inflata]|uniref:Hypothetical_protein n=1 Tax=Hexamita inflata TaxID=28002 RepID=A0AA86PIQ2_9EUKA|nr:Hypothetical protein HINF_LOCUS9093 [Hexamita inflata]CAI9940485.1 Hypothetical protein HINF_LOCUS28130 [Hexamita inflata]
MNLEQQKSIIEANKQKIQAIQSQIQQQADYQKDFYENVVKPQNRNFEQSIDNMLLEIQDQSSKKEDTKLQQQYKYDLLLLISEMKQIYDYNQAISNQIMQAKQISTDNLKQANEQLKLMQKLKQK